MIVAVSDTSPLRSLILVEQVDVLPQLFDQVLVPPAVLLELSQARTPEPARLWAASPPTWLSIREPAHIDHSLNLGAGEEAAVALAREVQAAMVLIDDRDAVRAARARGLTVVGTLALLDEAAERGLIPDLSRTLERLTNDTNFRVSKATDQIFRDMLQRDQERKRAREPKPDAEGPETDP
jgi:predicted nucleic acid-binding protein